VTSYSLFYVFLHKHVGYTKEAITAAEQKLTKEKLALENFQHDIHKFTAHTRLYICQIMNVGSPVQNQHFILVFSALRESLEDEFKLTICNSTMDGEPVKVKELI
jgi:DUF438 domain-containing protein